MQPVSAAQLKCREICHINSVLFVVVFKTALYNETVSGENYRDYIHFLGKVGASPLELSIKNVQGHELLLQGKRLICLHEYFEI
jgi:hypothetical protein